MVSLSVRSLTSHPLRRAFAAAAAHFSPSPSPSPWALAIRKASTSSPLKALLLYSCMHRQSLSFDSFSILFALKSCAHLPNNTTISIARHLHTHLLKLGFSAHVYVATTLLAVYASTAFRDACILFDEIPAPNTVTWNVMITGYSRQGDTKAARGVFDSMPQRDMASWTAMISAYVDSRLWDHGLALFRQVTFTSMNGNGKRLYPDQLMMGSLLGGCGRMGSVGVVFGKSIHGFVIKSEWELNAELGACLVDMYARCGLLRDACLIFNRMKRGGKGDNVVVGVVATTSLICGAAKHGHGREALQIFEEAIEAGMRPNELTLTGILTACVQAGLLDEGRRHFGMMFQRWGLRPNIHHYGCMVDLFGRAGMLGAAYELINTMPHPYKPNVVIWGSFLSSCKVHGQLELAEKVIDRAMAMVRPENDSGVYSLICDVYVLQGKWDEAERIRRLMLEQKVWKVRGSSFIGGTGIIY
ncbi:pentatricopeptide repeat-containing protein At5g66520-like [Andrographis paniculata]|uniref:pentatricopeptide repeat-containing protein At5g66520-like n=1 Tax=Andrographis paniculata TaxID=175694 RepID=UPI0021E99FDA|nr:pentatricopeptide repeat-containing protein At5g66520-like [Andrographis paniculata]